MKSFDDFVSGSKDFVVVIVLVCKVLNNIR